MKKHENIEDIMKEIEEFQPVVCLRLSIIRFMEKLSFDDVFMKSVREYKRNKKQIDFYNSFKIIRNGCTS